MQKPQTKALKYKNKKSLNIGMIIIIIIILYLVFYMCSYFFSSHVSYYEVCEGSTASKFDAQYTALAIRNEALVYSQDSGYIRFLTGESTPVYVGQAVYSIDKNGDLSTRLLDASSTSALLNENDYNELKESIFEFDTSFNESNYYETYNFKYKIESQILDLINNSTFQASSANNYFSSYRSEYAGVIVHSYDGYENITTDTIESSLFRRENYEKVITRTNDYVNAGTPIYKVITSDSWSLIFQMQNKEPFEKLDAVTVEFLKDNISLDGKFSLKAIGGNYYGIITLDKYMIRYSSDRYLQISIIDDSISGLKIPKSSVVEKSYYAIPVEFATQGGNSNQMGFMKQATLSDGTISTNFFVPDIILTTDEYYYVSLDSFEDGDIINKEESTSTFTIGIKDKINGVYVYNGGETIFKYISILGENNEYYIVDSSVSNSIKMYDQILSNVSNKDN